MLTFEVTALPNPSYLVRVEDDNGARINDCYVYEDGETVVVENMRGKITSFSQWFSAVAEHFPSAKFLRFERGSPRIGNVRTHTIKLPS